MGSLGLDSEEVATTGPRRRDTNKPSDGLQQLDATNLAAPGQFKIAHIDAV